MSIHPTRRAGVGAGGADVSLDDAIAQLGRILDSETFSRAQVLRRFLQCLVERTLQGRTDEIKEYALGVDVFDRGSEFDPMQARGTRRGMPHFSVVTIFPFGVAIRSAVVQYAFVASNAIP